MSYYEIKRTAFQIDEQLNNAASWEEKGITDSGNATFEEGVSTALRWVFGLSEDVPIEAAADLGEDEGDDSD